MADQHWTYRFCRFIKKLQLYFSGSPYMKFDSKTAKSVLEKANQFNGHEIQEYREVWTQRWWSMCALVIWTLFLDIKYLFVITLTLNSADHSEPERNIKLVSSHNVSSIQYRFNCLMSNCSKPLSGIKSHGLGYDFKRVPHMWLCHPELANTGQFSPWDLLDTQTLLNQAALIIFITLEGIVYPSFQAAFASHNESLMFILAPKVTTSLVCDKLLEFYQDLQLSYLNYRSTSLKLQRERQLGKPSKARLLWLAPRQSPLQLNPQRRDSDRLQTYVRDCLPAIRLADWWRPRAANILSSIFVGMIVVCALVESAYTITTLIVIEKHRSAMFNYARELERQKCRIWFADSGKFVDLERPILNYNPYIVFEYSIFFTGIALLLSSVLSLYYVLVVELNLWVNELELKLAIAIELLRLQNIMFDAHTSTKNVYKKKADLLPVGAKQEIASFNLAQIRDKLIKSGRLNAMQGFVGFNLKDFALKQSPTEAKLVHQMYALKLLHEHQPGAHIECIEKVYLSFRLFLDLVRQYGRLTAPLLMFAHPLTYSFAAVGVYYTLNIRDLTFEALLLAFGLMLFVAIFIHTGASFHSNAMRLSPLVWSLMAQITQSNEPRYAHLLLLWSKLHSLINDQGGIYLEALGRRFDYFNIVQLTVGTSTIMILAMKN